MTQLAIPCLFMRAGTSRGPFFDGADLPADPAARDALLLAVLGADEASGQIDGLGGGSSLTNKVAIVSRSARRDADVEYTFAQVLPDRGRVDVGPSCGNMLAGVGPFAIEAGMAPPCDGETVVRILDRNTGARVAATVCTPGGRVAYDRPIRLDFAGVAGAKTGRLLPTGRARERIDGLEASLVDAATPMMLVRAADFALSGHETPAEIDAANGALERIERMRREAGRRMGLGDVSASVLPKVALLAPPRAGGTISSRYLTPWRTHTAHAVTGAICIAAASAIPGGVASDVAHPSPGGKIVRVEHPAGILDVAIETCSTADGIDVVRAGVIRTARLLMRGEAMAPVAAAALTMAA